MAVKFRGGAIILALTALPVLAKAETFRFDREVGCISGEPSTVKPWATNGRLDYKVKTFKPREEGLSQSTCVSVPPNANAMALSDADMAALPPRWYLMRSKVLTRAERVFARYLITDHGFPMPATDPVLKARDLIRALYAAVEQAEMGRSNLFESDYAAHYCFADLATLLRRQLPSADLLTGEQDSHDHVNDPLPAFQPMLRGMIVVDVGITNFGRSHAACFHLRLDPNQSGSLIRIERNGWHFLS